MTKPSFLFWFVPLIDLCIFSSARTRSFICIILWMDWWVPSFFRVANSLWAIKVYPGQRAGGIEGDMMAANELNAHAFLQVSKLIPGKAFYTYSLAPFGNCKLRYLNKNYMEKILLSFAPKNRRSKNGWDWFHWSLWNCPGRLAPKQASQKTCMFNVNYDCHYESIKRKEVIFSCLFSPLLFWKAAIDIYYCACELLSNKTMNSLKNHKYTHYRSKEPPDAI